MEWITKLEMWTKACTFCRLCMDNPGTVNILTPVDWSQDIFTHTGIRVTQNQDFHGEKLVMPHHMCETCHDTIQKAKILRAGARSSNKKWQMKRQELELPLEKFENVTSDIEGEKPCITTVNGTAHSSAGKTITGMQRKRKTSSTSLHQDQKKAPNGISVRKDLFNSVQSDKNRRNHSNGTTSSRRSDQIMLTTPQVLDMLTGEDEAKSSQESSQTVTSTTTIKSSSPNSSLEIPLNNMDLECDTCHKKYETRKKLYFHKLTHNKKFLCPLDLCGKRFAIKGDLQKHIRSHTGEKPFQCNLCNQTFSQKVSLKAHDETVHWEKHT